MQPEEREGGGKSTASVRAAAAAATSGGREDAFSRAAQKGSSTCLCAQRARNVSIRVSTGASEATDGARPALRDVAPLSRQRAGSVDWLGHAGARMLKPWDCSLPPCRACAKQRGTWWTRFVSGKRLQPNILAIRISQFLLVVHQLELGSQFDSCSFLLFLRHPLAKFSTKNIFLLCEHSFGTCCCAESVSDNKPPHCRTTSTPGQGGFSAFSLNAELYCIGAGGSSESRV